MRAVKDRNTTPELTVRSMVHRMGYRFRLHRKDLPGKPDLVLPRLKKVIFVHGCFWHGHNCARGARMPKTNAAYWQGKIGRNRERDREHLGALKAAGWGVVIVWECALRNAGRVRWRLAKALAIS